MIIGRDTFSAAQNTISELERRTKAILVGEPTGSSPNFIGESLAIPLPYSGWDAEPVGSVVATLDGDGLSHLDPAGALRSAHRRSHAGTRRPATGSHLAVPRASGGCEMTARAAGFVFERRGIDLVSYVR